MKDCPNIFGSFKKLLCSLYKEKTIVQNTKIFEVYNRKHFSTFYNIDPLLVKGKEKIKRAPEIKKKFGAPEIKKKKKK